MAGKLQMDQAAPPDQGVRWIYQKCRKDSGLDCRLCLRAVAIFKKRLAQEASLTKSYRCRSLPEVRCDLLYLVPPSTASRESSEAFRAHPGEKRTNKHRRKP